MTTKQPINIYIFPHEDLAGYTRNQIFEGYLDWLVEELELISGRTVKILYRNEVESTKLKTFNYKNENHGEALREWTALLEADLAERWNIRPSHSTHDKYLLLTRDIIGSSAAGVTIMGGHTGIASITTYHVPAHEVGHMLGATHEDSEVLYNGWWNETIMLADDASQLRGKTYRYSDKNREHIRNHLKKLD